MMPLTGIKSDVWSISWNDFIKFCNDFVKISDKLNDGWALCGNDNTPGGLYLLKKVYNYETCVNEKSDCEESCNLSNVTQWEYHILYSPSYGVPTLYFNVWKRDGSILKIDEVIRLTGTQDNYNKTFVISQQEHPLLLRPFYFIHPCDTAAILKSCQTILSSETACRKSVNPIITWLSTIASTVRIELPTEYGFQ